MSRQRDPIHPPTGNGGDDVDHPDRSYRCEAVECVFSRGDPELSFTRDEILDNITLYWLTNTETSSARIYWENGAANAKLTPISIPAAVTVFPGEVYRPPKSWAQRAYKNLIYYNRVDKGGHFAAWEEPELFSREVRAAFRTLR